MNKGQGLVEYAFILVIVLIIAVVILAVIYAPQPTACNRQHPLASDIVDCIATRTAEARNK